MSRFVFYQNLHMGPAVAGKGRKYKRLLRTGFGRQSYYVLTLSGNEDDQLDITKAIYFKQSYYKDNPPTVVGFARDYDDALLLVEKLLMEVYEKTGSGDIRGYLEKEELC